MAVTKIWAIKDNLQRVLDYAANPDKTEYDALAQTLHYAENDAKTKLNESAQLVTGIHCRADHAWEDMRAVQERFGKTDGVVALHAYQALPKHRAMRLVSNCPTDSRADKSSRAVSTPHRSAAIYRQLWVTICKNSRRCSFGFAHCKLLPSTAFSSAVVNMALRWAT